MLIERLKLVSVGALLLGATTSAFGHGLVQNPPARNSFCGQITKPDHVLNNVAQYPVCGDAFDFDFNAGYNFMSVLTHTQGRAVTGVRENVCGYNSEFFGGGQTVWDQPINWPTNSMGSGTRTFTWNISWGPHFSDTEEFRYWITVPSFQYQVGQPLSFSQFESTPFCTLTYNDANPTGNPAVVADHAAALFHTTCNVPARSGRHVIYAEWGRNFFTFERFHGCIDVVFGGPQTPTPTATPTSRVTPTPTATPTTRATATPTTRATATPTTRATATPTTRATATPTTRATATPTTRATATPTTRVTPTPTSTGGVTATVAINNDWGAGYCANLVVTNGTSSAVTWNVNVTIVGTVSNAWNITWSQSGTTLNASGVGWNNVLQPGASTQSTGFCANR